MNRRVGSRLFIPHKAIEKFINPACEQLYLHPLVKRFSWPTPARLAPLGPFAVAATPRFGLNFARVARRGLGVGRVGGALSPVAL